MAAVAYAYERDTHVIDPEDLEEVAEMQVKIIGDDGRACFHRYMAQTGGLLTACDEPQIVRASEIVELRAEAYEGDMCRGGCFSKSELARCDEANEARRKRNT